MNDKFGHIARLVSVAAGSAYAFLVAILSIVVWAAVGPHFHFSDTWQLVINTGTTIVTFLMVFLIQNAQNRDATAIHLKLDELIRATEGARNKMIDLDRLNEEQMKLLRAEFERICSAETQKA
ncbi:low affinity iron permease family protein [bacterium]|nr:MAG: low affinity iron permease family protein [bacterium]